MSEPTTGISLDILSKFCSDDEYRPSLSAITHDGEFAFATDGLILVRTASSHPATEGKGAEKLAESVRNLFAANFPATESDLWTSEIPTGTPETELCKTCGGSGKSQECPSCDGDGNVHLDHSWMDAAKKWHNDDYECECRHCEGSGKIGGESDDCDDCGGTGSVDKPTACAFGIAFFDAKQLNRLRGLPGLQMHPLINGKPMQPHPIRGDGWTGIISPMRTPEVTP